MNIKDSGYGELATMIDERIVMLRSSINKIEKEINRNLDKERLALDEIQIVSDELYDRALT